MDAVFIGGGAAGFFGAIAFAESRPGARVAILERGSTVLAKVRISGGGRCNVTHACYDPKTLIAHYPRGGKALLGPFHKFQPKHTVEWFEKRGVKLKTEADGRIFPTSDNSQTIIDALISAAKKAGIEITTGVEIESITAKNPPSPGPQGTPSLPTSRDHVLATRSPAGGRGDFMIGFKDGPMIHCDQLMLATGSNAQGWKWARELGHTLEHPVPSLFTFTVAGEKLKALAGISVERARVKIAGISLAQSGAVLITHWGLSGPATLKLSAWGARKLNELAYRARIEVNWVDLEQAEVMRRLHDEKGRNPRKMIAANPSFGLPKRLWERLVQESFIPEERRWADVSKVELNRLADELSASVYQMNGKSTFKEEFVTCGGVRLDEVDFRTMESRVRPGLYFAGEILDIDGVTGGFNFQSAWTTGWLGGKAMAEAR